MSLSLKRLVVLLIGSLAAACSAGAGEKTLEARLAPERGTLLAGSETNLGAVLRLTAPPAPEQSSPAGVAMSLVMDRSGSMWKDDKIGMLRRAGTGLVEKLAEGDDLALVAYSDDAQVLRPLGAVKDLKGVKGMITGIRPGGGTNLGGGLVTGIALLAARERNGSVRRLLLLTDGLANKGETRPEVLAKWAKEAFLRGMRISTVGLGKDYNERLLAKLAHSGGGEFYYVEKKEQLPELYRKELEDGRNVTVAELVVTVETSDGAVFREVVGYPATGGGEKSREVKVGDLFAGERRDLLLRFRLKPPAGAEKWRAAAVRLRWLDYEGRRGERDFFLEFPVTGRESEVLESVDPKVRARVIENENFGRLEEAMVLYRRGQTGEALKTIQKAEERINREKAAGGDKLLIKQAGQLAQARREIEQGHDARSTQIHNVHVANFGSRGGGGRKRAIARFGGSAASESSVDSALKWLAASQEKDGAWKGTQPADEQTATAMGLLAFMGAGHTEKSGRWRSSVSAAVGRLIARQAADGRIGGRGPLPAGRLARFRAVYEHALATLALVEAYGMGRAEKTRAAAQKALDWLCARKPFDGLEAKLPAATDQDVTGLAWCAIALKSAKTAGLKVPPEPWVAASRVLEAAEAREGGKATGRFGFFGREARPLDTTVGWLCRIYSGRSVREAQRGMAWALAQKDGLPRWGKDGAGFNWQYAYFTNLVCFQVGNGIWRDWNAHLRGELLGRQVRGKGFWEATGSLKDRGRIFSTALGSLCFEVYYRYLPMYR